MTRRSVALATLLVLLATCSGDRGSQPSLDEGDRAPDFSLPSAAGGEVGLSDFSGKKPVLLYFSMGPG